MDEFENERDFYNKYPSRLYLCSECNRLSPNPYFCWECGEQANKLIKKKGIYEYKINDNKYQIFIPIELVGEV